MSGEVDNLHGREKRPEPDDPMELMMCRAPAEEPELMADCLIEEYARLGMEEGQIFELFRQPFYGIHFLYQERGEEWIRQRIGEVLARTGRMRVRVTVADQTEERGGTTAAHHHEGGDADA